MKIDDLEKNINKFMKLVMGIISLAQKLPMK